jgi:5-methylthioadenosine/S-adenosylhomocysteine deaminase
MEQTGDAVPRVRIEGGLILTMDQQDSILEGGTILILVEGDRIAAIRPSATAAPAGSAETVIDARGMIVLPGLVNAHMHQRPMRGIADGYPLRTWHDVFVNEVSDLMTPDDAHAGASAGFAEALKGGVTTVMAGTIHPEAEHRAARDLGIRARLFAHVIRDDEVNRYFDLVKAQGGSEADRVRHWVGLEVAAISTSAARRAARQLASALDMRIHTHFSEDKRFDLAPLVADGFLGPDLHMAHCVHLTSEDIDILARHGVGVAHCPTSNLKLGNGVAPVPEMRAKGIAVGIATDGLIATGRLDLFEQMRIAGLMQRGSRRDATVLPAGDLLAMVTREAARAMGMAQEIGSLEVGKKADIVILDTGRLWLTPLVHLEKISNVRQLLAWSATPADVDTVLVDGRIVVRKRGLQSQDEQRIRDRVQAVGTRILSQAKFTMP